MEAAVRNLEMLVLSLLAMFVAQTPVAAWNQSGHRLVATIAYEHLDPEMRKKIIGYIKFHESRD